MNSDRPHASAITSVLLDQGEYFYDDEFTGSYDTQDRADIHLVMTRSLGNDVLKNGKTPLDQSHSDSCIFTPGDSGDSGLTSGQAGQTPSSEDNLEVKENYASQPPLNDPNCTKSNICSTGMVMSPLFRTGVSSNSFDMHNCRNEGLVVSFDGSVNSGQSNSWMQGLLERSCTPNMRALLTRTAASVDYKIAYDDYFANYSDSTAHLQYSNMEPNSNSLPQMSAELPSPPTTDFDRVTVTRHTLSNPLKPPLATSPDAIPPPNPNPHTTTWVGKHGSRESLKGQSSSVSQGTSSVSSTSLQGSHNDSQRTSWKQHKRTPTNAQNQAATTNDRSRSRSQPVLNDTLVDIFLRSKGSRGSLADANKHFAATDTSSIPYNPSMSTGKPLLSNAIASTNVALQDESSKHPLLRGDRILPAKPAFETRSFGTQFPSAINSDAQNRSQFQPDPSRTLPKQGSTMPFVNPSWLIDVRKSLPTHPTALYNTHQNNISEQSVNKHLSTSDYHARPTTLHAVSMTSSAGPFGPREYPGLGPITLPRTTHLSGVALLSQTLPDLSFLAQAGAKEEQTGTPTMLRPACCSSPNGLPRKLKPRSISLGRAYNQQRGYPQHAAHRVSKQCSDVHHECDSQAIRQDVIPSSRQIPQHSQSSSLTVERGRHHWSANIVEGTWSDPNSVILDGHEGSLTASNYDDHRRHWMQSSTGMSASLSERPTPKKSVSFSDNIRLVGALRNHHRPLTAEAGHSTEEGEENASPKLNAIPKSWGLYGDEPPRAEFKPRNSPCRETRSNSASNVDIRYFAMVNDVIHAVQETVAHFSSSRRKANVAKQQQQQQLPDNGAENNNLDILPYSEVAARGSSGRQALAAVVGPLCVLLSDGLVGPSRLISYNKSKPKLWTLVDESCRTRSRPTQVTSQALNDALAQVKAVPFATSDKQKFKAFVCACLNAKILSKWLESLVASDSLLKRFYCEDAFLRQCRTTQSGLYADILTHLQQLIMFPFNLDVSMEARKPYVVETQSHTASNNLSRVPSDIATRKASSAPASETSSASTALKVPSTTATFNKPRAPIPARRPLAPQFSTGVPARASSRLTHHDDPHPQHQQHYPQHHLPSSLSSRPTAPATASNRHRFTGPSVDSTSSTTSAVSEAAIRRTAGDAAKSKIRPPSVAYTSRR